ncbi:MAG TPA: fumarylacetoacetate hydrolase family protein [Thermoplasmata archaeon]|jgi:2-keto-4-pentenoate hydratase/2-oxohepta-3-ene-1,7-dioic acid hydratase in catechol pathway
MTTQKSSEPKYGKFAKDRRTFMGEVRGDEVVETDASCLADAMRYGAEPTSRRHRLGELRTLAPVDRPSKIVCIGLNYRSHIREMKAEIPKTPIIFSKPSSAVIGPEEAIVIPTMSTRVDFEGESALVIGRRASQVKGGLGYVFGYTCLNDVTARDLQKTDVDWTRAKGFDTFAPVGPYISRRPPTRVTTRLNGKTVQDAPLSDRVFGDAALVEYISGIMTLEPGDIIATGTPSGIAPMDHGDVVEVELDGVGCLRNQVVRPR